ncbi:MAG TPA: sensor domain-containing diguanylate cyclase [Candidatus Tectomicrobia bacterium]|jgi:diguanylate cyclase (GGDEF)-like protein
MEDHSSLTRHQLLSCLELGKALTAELDPSRLFDTILKKVSALLPAEQWSLLLLDEATGELHFALSVDLEPTVIKDLRLRLGEGIAGHVALQQQPMVVEDVRQSPFFSARVDQRTGFTTKSIMCVPLIFGGRTVGVIEVVNSQDLGASALHLLTVIADYAAIAVENTRRYYQIQTLAIQDSVTGLYNTRYLYQALETLLATSAAAAMPLALLFLDIDDFKRVVDTYGHLNGTQVLQEVAQTIRQSVAAPAFGVSYGGDEFVVVLPGMGKRQALHKAEEIRQTLSQTSFLTNRGLQVQLQASFGVATYPEDATDRTGLLALADQAMFNVKRRGKNAVGVNNSTTRREAQSV